MSMKNNTIGSRHSGDEANDVIEDELQKYFSDRRRLLHKLVANHPNLHRQIELRERRVRCEALQAAAADAPDTHQKFRYQRDAIHQEILLATNTSTTPWWYDSMVFEWHGSVMASVSLLLHCWAYVGIGRVLAMVEPVHFGWWVGTLVVSVLLLRSTGDIYWWLSDDTASCVQHDRRNQAALLGRGHWILWLARENMVMRAALFIVGYSICYEGFVYFPVLFESKIFDDWFSVVESLPSIAHKNDFGICPAEMDADSYCTSSCQTGLERSGEFRL